MADQSSYPAVVSTEKPDFLTGQKIFYFFPLNNHKDKDLVFLLCKEYITHFHLI